MNSKQPHKKYSRKSFLRETIVLYLEDIPLARIYLNDPWREDSRLSLQLLKEQDYSIALLTGDPSVDSVAGNGVRHCIVQPCKLQILTSFL